jgi:DnaK suppressor protein
MTVADLNKYRAVLRTRAAELSQALRRREEISVEAAADAMDQTLLAVERDMEIENLDRGYKLLRQIQAALGRINKGNYGQCLKCEAEILPNRLQAVPWAAFCVGCQESVDRLQEKVHALRGRVAVTA